MKDILILYIFAFVTALLLVSGFVFVFLKFKKNEKYLNIKKWYVRGSVIFLITIFVVSYFFQDNAMVPFTYPKESSHLAGGLVNLIGVPYGNNKAANFFAWLQIALIYPCLLGMSLIPFYEFKTGKRVTKYIILPLSILNFGFLFNFLNGIYGSIQFNYKQVLSSIQIGALLGTTIIYAFSIWKDEDSSIKLKDSKKKLTLEIIHLATYFLFMVIFTLPIYTAAALLNENSVVFGRAMLYWRILDFSLFHRFALYLTLLVPIFIYFLNRNKSIEARSFIVLYVTLGALLLFSTTVNFQTMFPVGKDGIRHVSATNLPIHLCHTALYVTPICIITRSKKLFYFTYFINVFGAMCAMLMPNYAEYYSLLHPTLYHFWSNHMVAFYAPLLSVALGLFDRPKFKQMVWSLLFFFVYFVIIVFANAWLSNYVNGYKPDKIGSGTDYLFINGDFILDKLGTDAKILLNTKLTWTQGKCTFVIYPLYQLLFFIGYAGIAFAMWFLYSLFFRISDDHKELRNRLLMMKKKNTGGNENGN